MRHVQQRTSHGPLLRKLQERWLHTKLRKTGGYKQLRGRPLQDKVKGGPGWLLGLTQARAGAGGSDRGQTAQKKTKTVPLLSVSSGGGGGQCGLGEKLMIGRTK